MTPLSERQIRCPDCGLMRSIYEAHCECGSHNVSGFFKEACRIVHEREKEVDREKG